MLLWAICTNIETAFGQKVQGRAELAAIASETCEMAWDFYLEDRTPASPTRARKSGRVSVLSDSSGNARA
jgi:hypothetical protein